MRNLLVLSLVLGGLSGCATISTTSVPGVLANQESTTVTNTMFVKESQVLEALKCQITRGLLEVERLKRDDYADYPGVDDFLFKSGSGTLAGKMQTIQTSQGTFSIVFPFSGFAGTNATPNYGKGVVVTDSGERKRTFDINTTEVSADDLQLCLELENDGVKVGNFLETAITTAFSEAMDVGEKTQYGPKLTNTLAETTTTFSVERKTDVGFALVSLPSAPRIDKGNAGFTKNVAAASTYTLTTKLNTKVAANSDSRRLIYCVRNALNSSLCAEEPFTKERWQQHKELLKEGGPVLAAFPLMVPANQPNQIAVRSLIRQRLAREADGDALSAEIERAISAATLSDNSGAWIDLNKLVGTLKQFNGQKAFDALSAEELDKDLGEPFEKPNMDNLFLLPQEGSRF